MLVEIARENLRRLRVVTKQTWFRFYDVVPYLLLCKFPRLKYLGVLQFLNFIFSLLACSAEREKTSGKQLVFVKSLGLGLKITFNKCYELVRKRNGSWSGVFSIYYPEQDHEINVLARNSYGN